MGLVHSWSQSSSSTCVICRGISQHSPMGNQRLFTWMAFPL